jgi:hypothetical protein
LTEWLLELDIIIRLILFFCLIPAGISSVPEFHINLFPFAEELMANLCLVEQELLLGKTVCLSVYGDSSLPDFPARVVPVDLQP